MGDAILALGIALMMLGIAPIVAVFRTLKHEWSGGADEIWAFPVAGVGLVPLGRWLIR